MTGGKRDICFVQFPHPGPERPPEGKVIVPWNTKRHTRLFMQTQGVCCDDISGNNQNPGELAFWGEWEADAKLQHEWKRQKKSCFPKFLYVPDYVRANAASVGSLQNTDPYVFGKCCFYYSNCRQANKPTLRHLKIGSVIVFGSRRECNSSLAFGVDSVFVVAGCDEYDANNYNDSHVNAIVANDPIFEAVTLKPLASSCGGSHCSAGSVSQGCAVAHAKLQLYYGATPGNDVEGMFSYSPCLPIDKAMSSRCFYRPLVNIKGINPKNGRAVKITPRLTMRDVKDRWLSITDQILSDGQGLKLGIRFHPPALDSAFYRASYEQ